MKYPVFINYFEHKRLKDDEYYDRLVYYDADDCDLYLSKELCRFCMQLNGKTDPYKLGIPTDTVNEHLAFLEENDLLRKKRFMRSRATCMYALSFHTKADMNKRYRAFIYSLFLAVFSIPMLVIGCVTFELNFSKVMFCSESPLMFLFSGEFLGMIFGAAFHELGHYSSTLGFGGDILETGVGIYIIAPFAYVVNDVSGIRNRLLKMQIDAAGIESNFLLCGLCACIASIPTIVSWLFVGIALANLMLGLLNALPVSIFSLELDGAHILKDATNENIIRQCFRNVFLRKDRHRVLHSHYGGLKLAGSLIVSAANAFIPCYYAYVFISAAFILKDIIFG